MKKLRRMDGNAAGDAAVLALVRAMTMCLSLVTTRVLSTYLSTFAYGTYAQILLIVSTTASLTMFGLIDAINFYYCGAAEPEKQARRRVTTLVATNWIKSKVDTF